MGPGGIAWSEHGIVGLELPEANEARTRARLRKRFPGAPEVTPPSNVQGVMEAVAGALGGESRHEQSNQFAAVALDMDGVPPFHRRVYEVVRTIPAGSTRSCHQVAVSLGAPGAEGAVGTAVGRNPFPIIVPSHRVLRAGGTIGGDAATTLRLLSHETEKPSALPFDPVVAVEHLRAVDADLAGAIASIGPLDLRLNSTPTVFIGLAEAIVYQQLNGRVAEKIFARVCALFPYRPEGPSARQLLAASDGKLRGAGLSGAKLLSLRDLARRVVAHDLPELDDLRAMDDDAIIERLSQVRGIGRWTAEMFLIFRLGRPDVLPVDDYGVRQGFAVAMQSGLPTPQALESYGERWRPYRTVASWYLWRAQERGTQPAR